MNANFSGTDIYLDSTYLPNFPRWVSGNESLPGRTYSEEQHPNAVGQVPAGSEELRQDAHHHEHR